MFPYIAVISENVILGPVILSLLEDLDLLHIKVTKLLPGKSIIL